MKFASRMAVPCLLSLLLPSCGISGGPTTLAEARQPKGTGPFDNRGNYIDDWADSPSKWQQDNLSAPVIVSRIPSPEPSRQQPMIGGYNETASIPISTSMTASAPMVINHSAPRPTVTAPQAPVRSEVVVASRSAVSKPAVKKATASKPTKSKATAKKETKKPSLSRYVIRRGDSLSSIASRNKTTVAALKKANKISGTLIHPGKALVIPR